MTICSLRQMAERIGIHPNSLRRMILSKPYPGVFKTESGDYRFHAETFVEALCIEYRNREDRRRKVL